MLPSPRFICGILAALAVLVPLDVAAQPSVDEILARFEARGTGSLVYYSRLVRATRNDDGQRDALLARLTDAAVQADDGIGYQVVMAIAWSGQRRSGFSPVPGAFPQLVELFARAPEFRDRILREIPTLEREDESARLDFVRSTLLEVDPSNSEAIRVLDEEFGPRGVAILRSIWEEERDLSSLARRRLEGIARERGWATPTE